MLLPRQQSTPYTPAIDVRVVTRLDVQRGQVLRSGRGGSRGRRRRQQGARASARGSPIAVPPAHAPEQAPSGAAAAGSGSLLRRGAPAALQKQRLVPLRRPEASSPPPVAFGLRAVFSLAAPRCLSLRPLVWRCYWSGLSVGIMRSFLRAAAPAEPAHMAEPARQRSSGPAAAFCITSQASLLNSCSYLQRVPAFQPAAALGRTEDMSLRNAMIMPRHLMLHQRLDLSHYT